MPCLICDLTWVKSSKVIIDMMFDMCNLRQLCETKTRLLSWSLFSFTLVLTAYYGILFLELTLRSRAVFAVLTSCCHHIVSHELLRLEFCAMDTKTQCVDTTGYCRQGRQSVPQRQREEPKRSPFLAKILGNKDWTRIVPFEGSSWFPQKLEVGHSGT